MSTQSLGGGTDYVTWSESPANPVVPLGLDHSFARVLHQGGQYLMWTSREAGGGIFLRTSSDGVAWSAATPCSGIVAGARHPAVLFNEDLGRFEMWYWIDGSDYDMTRFRRARSADGLNWTDSATCGSAPIGHRPVYTVWANSIGTHGPSHVFHNSGAPVGPLNYADLWQNRYVMYYHQLRQNGDKSAVAVAVSADGLIWGVPVEGQAVLDVGPTGAWDSKAATWATVLRDGAGYHMYYAGGQVYRYGLAGVGYASSLDGRTWTKHPTPILTRDPASPWRAFALGSPSIIEVNGERRLFAYSWDGTVSYAVGLFTQQPPDSTPPAIALNVSPITVQWPPNGTQVPVTVSGSATDADSGLAAVSLQVVDEYGQLDQTLDLLAELDSSGGFSQSITLVAFQQPGDGDGREFQFILSARDSAGHEAEPLSVTVNMPLPDLTAPAIALDPPSLAELWPPTGLLVPVTISGSATDTESGLASVTLQVQDEYGQLDQTLPLLAQLDPLGGFSLTVPLTAFRNDTDGDGREYRLVLSAADAVGNQATPLAVSVICPHNREHDKLPKPPKSK
jgi:hypothetical protein